MTTFLRRLLVAALFLALPASASAQITGLNSFSPSTRILSADVNFNFTKLADESLKRNGSGSITGNVTVDDGITIDGIDLSAWLDQSVKVAATPTFAGLTVSGTGASSLDIGGGLNAGTGNVAIIDATGKIPVISSTYFASLDGTSLTGVALLGSANTFTARNDFKTYSETKTSPSISSNALTIDLSAGTHFSVALNANITTFTVSNPVSSGTVGSFTIKFTADGTTRSITWPSSFKWAGGSAPVAMTGTNNRKDIVTCIYDDGGTTYNCAISQNFPA